MLPWRSPAFDDHEQVLAFSRPAVGMKAIIAVHSTTLGAAVGGTRFYPYDDDAAALDDVLRLSRAMSFKCALAGVPFGGGKAVIIGDPTRPDAGALLRCYAEILNCVGISFATGEDVGITPDDCDMMAEISPYVAGTRCRGIGDPAGYTAAGVLEGIFAVCEAGFGRRALKGIRVAVQGLGAVGAKLCELLHREGVRLVVADVDESRVRAAIGAFGAKAVATDRIHAASADVFSPCAMGGAINEANVGEISARFVAGAANNQLATPAVGAALYRRGVLYCPDFVINAGGVLGATEELCRMPGRPSPPQQPVETRIAAIRPRLVELLAAAKRDGLPPEVIAEARAREIIESSRYRMGPRGGHSTLNPPRRKEPIEGSGLN